MPGGAGNQNLLAKRVDWMVYDGDSGTKLPNACGIPLSYDGLNCETILVMEKLLEQISGVRANTSNKPTGVDCDCFGHGLVEAFIVPLGDLHSMTSRRRPKL
jgi:hypothetical protein